MKNEKEDEEEEEERERVGTLLERSTNAFKSRTLGESMFLAQSLARREMSTA